MLLLGVVFWPESDPCCALYHHCYFRRMFVALIQRNILTVASAEAGGYFLAVKDCVMSESSFETENQSRMWTLCRWPHPFQWQTIQTDFVTTVLLIKSNASPWGFCHSSHFVNCTFLMHLKYILIVIKTISNYWHGTYKFFALQQDLNSHCHPLCASSLPGRVIVSVEGWKQPCRTARI